MALETKKERFIFLGVIPLAAATIGALATTLSAGNCQLGPNTDFISILSNSGLTGAEKVKALEIYEKVTNRPWDLVSSLVTILSFTMMILVWSIADWIKSKARV